MPVKIGGTRIYDVNAHGKLHPQFEVLIMRLGQSEDQKKKMHKAAQLVPQYQISLLSVALWTMLRDGLNRF